MSQAEGVCLRHPENLGFHQTVSLENASNMLMRAVSMAQHVPFQWAYIDKPQEGQVMLLFIQQSVVFPNDGIRYLEQETMYTIPIGGGREMEVFEVKHGFIPSSQDTSAWRMRRRYRLLKGGHPQIFLVHYTRGPIIPVPPPLINQPVRSYPLRPLNEPSVFVIGEKAGQMVYAQQAPGPAGATATAAHLQTPMPPRSSTMSMGHPPPPHPHQPQHHPQMMMGGINAGIPPQALLAQQNANMEALERRSQRERERERGLPMGAVRPPPSAPPPGTHPPRIEDDDSADELDQISTRTLAVTRYRRNHELMNEVFTYAAFPNARSPPPPSPFSIFDKADLEAKVTKLSAEIQDLQQAAAARRAKAAAAERVGLGEAQGENEDVSME